MGVPGQWEEPWEMVGPCSFGELLDEGQGSRTGEGQPGKREGQGTR